MLQRRLIVILLLGWLGLATAWAAPRVSVYALFKDKAVLRIDGKQRTLRVGETSPEGIKLVEATSRAAVLEIDGQRVTKPLGSHVGTGLTAPEKTTLKVMKNPSGMYQLNGLINGRSVPFMVDTGATLVAMSSLTADRLGIDYLGGKVGYASTASGQEKAYGVTLDSVQVGSIRLTQVEAMVMENSYMQGVLLGMSFLGRLDMQNSNGVLTLRQKY